MSLKEKNSAEPQMGSNFLTVEGDGNHQSNRRRSSSTDTKYQRSLRHYLTREALPSEPHYRNLNSIVAGVSSGRPTLEELHDATLQEKQLQNQKNIEEGVKKKQKGKVIKFGWIEGVYIRCLLNIWGVMLFLRVSWVVGEAGILFGVLVVLLGNTITFITSISMSAVATNGQIKAGGIYYMISRSLGPEFGGSIGLLFTLANSIAAATYIIGFVNALQGMFQGYFDNYEIIPGAGGGKNDIRILGSISLIFVLALAIVGMEWVNRVQIVLLVLLLASQLDFIVGAFMGPESLEEKAQGFVGFNGDVFSENMKRDYRYFQGDQNFFSVFGVFFSAVTGIVAGANLSGDLKDPASAIPKGTILAILSTCASYIIYPIMIGGSFVRDAVGNESLYDDSYDNVYDNPAFNVSYCGGFEDSGMSTCEYGLQNNFHVMEVMAVWGPLIYVGCFAATISSAIAALVGAPRVLQALAKDRLYPLIHVFEVGYGANNDPVRGYILVFVLAFACVMIGSLNAVSTLLTNCFLASYALINFSCFHVSLMNSPGWRPSFKYFNKYVSLFGGIICIAVMFLIDWVTALLTLFVAILLYLYVAYRKPDVNWGSSTQAQTYLSALKSTMELVSVEEHVKNYRPQILLLSGHPNSRPALVDFAHNITKNVSFLSCGNVMTGPVTQCSRNILTIQANKWFTNHKIRSFYSLVEAKDLEEGSKFLFQIVGLGKLRPNVVLLGYKADWRKCKANDLKAYFNTVHDALNMYLGIAILRVPGGLDYSHVLEDTPITSTYDEHILNNNMKGSAANADTECKQTNVTDFSSLEKHKKHTQDKLYKGIGGIELPKDVLNKVTMFKRKQKKGTIDVWWLYDDGGLTLLIPYILSTKNQYANCKLRVFALANRKNELDIEQRSLANLLSKFRIDVCDMIIIPDLAKRAEESSQMEFEDLIRDFQAKNKDSEANDDRMLISEAELLALKEKTNRHIRLRELLLTHSKNSSLIVMTLPMPRKNSVSAPLYMAWLETLTKDMPNFLLIRGNQTSVLTFYS